MSKWSIAMFSTWSRCFRNTHLVSKPGVLSGYSSRNSDYDDEGDGKLLMGRRHRPAGRPRRRLGVAGFVAAGPVPCASRRRLLLSWQTLHLERCRVGKPQQELMSYSNKNCWRAQLSACCTRHSGFMVQFCSRYSNILILHFWGINLQFSLKQNNRLFWLEIGESFTDSVKLWRDDHSKNRSRPPAYRGHR